MSLSAKKVQKKKKWEENSKYFKAFVYNLHVLSSIFGSKEEEKKVEVE